MRAPVGFDTRIDFLSRLRERSRKGVIEVELRGGVWSIGAIIAMIVLVLAIVFWAVGKLPVILAALIGALALARLV